MGSPAFAQSRMLPWTCLLPPPPIMPAVWQHPGQWHQWPGQDCRPGPGQLPTGHERGRHTRL